MNGYLGNYVFVQMMSLALIIFENKEDYKK